jgi:hypothetical protein
MITVTMVAEVVMVGMVEEVATWASTEDPPAFLVRLEAHPEEAVGATLGMRLFLQILSFKKVLCYPAVWIAAIGFMGWRL